MAEGIVYLDVDDEITSAAQRIRSAPGTRVAMVVPSGSRIATSRMNFRLLSREAVMNNRRLSIVSGDAAARSLAASAGLPVFGSVGEYESSLVTPALSSAIDDKTGTERGADAGPGPAAAAPAAAAALAVGADAGLAASETVVVPTPAAADPPARKSQRPKRPIDEEATVAAAASTAAAGPAAPARQLPEPTRSIDDRDAAAADLPAILGGRIRAPVIAAIGLVALALIVAGVGAYIFLPSAAITLTPRRDAIPPVQITVSADPEVTVVDPDSSVVPAIRLDIPVEAAQTFTTTGVNIEESAARGNVTFTNYDTSSGVSIASGSIVSTEGGIRFRTQQTVVLQPASVFPAFEPKSDSVGVVAVRPGEQGNVPANTIRVVPQGQDPVLLRVNNPRETSGGTHTETPEIEQAEVDKAVAALQADLQAAFADAVAAGAGAPPDTTLFPETASLGVATPDVDPKTLVGQALETFDLRFTASGSVIAVDPRPVETLARAELDKHIAADHRLIETSVAIDVGDGSVGEDGQVTFQATVRASQVLVVDASALPGLVKGKTKAEAEAALAPFGTATVALWPDWVATVTGVDSRLSVVVADAPVGDGSGPSPAPGASSPRPSPTTGRSAGPAASRSPAPSVVAPTKVPAP
jgi:hypothetical protein